MKIAIIVSSQITISAFLLHQIRSISRIHDLTVIANFDNNEPNSMFCELNNVNFHKIPIQREIHIWKDLNCLWKLYRYFLSHRFDIIHSVTPKAGLLSMAAGKLASVQARVHTFTGQVWATKSGIQQLVLKNIDRFISFTATNVLVDSKSQMEFLLFNQIISPEKAEVLADGSISGVDVGRFHPDQTIRNAMRNKLKVDPSEFLVLFVGRLKKEKGVFDLVDAYNNIRQFNADIALVLVGPDEENIEHQLRERLGNNVSSVKFVPFTSSPEQYMSAADLFVLPSYREGFGSVIIEAAACRVPAVASNIYGLSDAVDDGKSGILFEVGNVKQLEQSINALHNNKELLRSYAQYAFRRAHLKFEQNIITSELITFYRNLSTLGL